MRREFDPKRPVRDDVCMLIDRLTEPHRVAIADARHTIGMIAEHALRSDMELHMKLGKIYHELADIVPATDEEAY
jgi:hypothetical protein